MIKQSEYGAVIITKGKHKGKIGLYDDDHYSKAIVYPYMEKTWITVPLNYITNIYDIDFVYKHTMGYSIKSHVSRK